MGDNPDVVVMTALPYLNHTTAVLSLRRTVLCGIVAHGEGVAGTWTCIHFPVRADLAVGNLTYGS